MQDDVEPQALRPLYGTLTQPGERARQLARLAVALSGAAWARVRLRSAPEWDEPTKQEALEAAGHADGADEPEEMSHPLAYQGRELGWLALPGREAARPSDGRPAPCPGQQLARHLAHHLMRHRAAHRARTAYARELDLVGTSPCMERVDRFLEVASPSPLPALLLGPDGSGVEQLGVALHVLAGGAPRPLVQVHAATLSPAVGARRWLALFRRAAGGTLLLAHLEELAKSEQRRLLHILEVGPGGWLHSHGRPPTGLRLLGSASTAAVAEGRLDRDLLDALGLLRVELEPLHRRTEDIPHLVEHLLLQHRREGGDGLLAPEVRERLRRYPWPGDVAELRRTVVRLVVAPGAEPLESLELHHLRERAPHVVGERATAPGETPEEAGGRTGWHDARDRDGLHPAVRRALRFLGDHHGEEVSLTRVAEAAHVSRSHLAHLLQHQLGTSYTRLLASVRVEHAKRLLHQDPWRSITFVAFQAGFPHLRQFERTFKKLVGCTPSNYRRRVRRHQRSATE